MTHGYGFVRVYLYVTCDLKSVKAHIVQFLRNSVTNSYQTILKMCWANIFFYHSIQFHNRYQFWVITILNIDNVCPYTGAVSSSSINYYFKPVYPIRNCQTKKLRLNHIQTTFKIIKTNLVACSNGFREAIFLADAAT